VPLRKILIYKLYLFKPPLGDVSDMNGAETQRLHPFHQANIEPSSGRYLAHHQLGVDNEEE
jgi:hypothetical protein